MKRSDAIIEFIELLRVPSGKGAGKPVRLREWQKKIIRAIYDPQHPDGRRKVRRVVISMGRKNGKTALIAFLVLVHLVGPEAKRGSQIYSAAMDKEQAAIIYQMAADIVALDDDLSAIIRPVPSRKRLVCYALGSYFQALSKDAKTKHGLNPAVWIFDELGQAKDSELLDTLATAQGAQEEPLGVIISTQAIDPLGPMSIEVEEARKVMADPSRDETLAAFIFEVPEDADPFDETKWHLANPALGDFRSLEDMRALASEARRKPSKLNSFKNLFLNQQVSGLEHIFAYADWKLCGDAVDELSLVGRKCFGGLDLSKRLDLTALALLFPPVEPGEKWKVILRVWTPEHSLAERSLQDRAHYPLWRDNGALIAVPGRSISYDYVAAEIEALRQKYVIEGIGFDAWRVNELKDKMTDIGLSYWVDGKDEPDPYGVRLVKIGQTFKDMGPCIDALEDLVVLHELAHGMNPVLTWAAQNVVAETDAIGNRRMTKKKAKNRIDPIVALTMAAGVASRGGSVESGEATQGFVDVEAA